MPDWRIVPESEVELDGVKVSFTLLFLEGPEPRLSKAILPVA
jgi:hypothetical protein